MSIADLVKKGIEDFDFDASVGRIPANWRSRIDLKSVRFGDPTKNIAVQVYGSYENVRRSAGNIRFAGEQWGRGLLSSEGASATALREAWEKALSTDSAWKMINRGIYTRKIKGVRVFLRYTDHWEIMVNGKALPGWYSSISSAKRAVRKIPL